MKKSLVLLSFLSLHLSLHAQSKWSAGYRLGLVHEGIFDHNSPTSRISNQVFASYRILKRLELEAGLQHTQTGYNTGGTDEMFRVLPYYSFSNFKAQVFSLSLAAKYSFLNRGPLSVYALTGLSSCMIYGHYTLKGGGPGGELLESRHSMPVQYKPLATIFIGFGVHYQVYPRIKLNAQVTAHGSNLSIKMNDNDYLGYLYNPDISTQIGFSYAL